MSKEQSTSRGTGWTLGWAGIKTALVVASLVVMLATNIASLVSGAVHDFLYGGLRKALLIGGNEFADRTLKSSKTSKALAATEDLRVDNKRLSDANTRARSDLDLAKRKSQALEAKNRQLASEADEMARTNKKLALDNDRHIKRRASDGRTAREIASKVRGRVTKNLARNTAAIPAEAIPYLGIGVVLSVTAMDIYDACQTANDFNELLKLMDQGVVQADMCGQKLPTRQEVINEAKAKWRGSVDAVVEAAREFPEMTLPETRLPTIGEAASSVCSVVKMPGLCH